ncbi:MAG: lysine--tRNA ligase [Ardenticatenales bacterium]|nr:lysine--tRNA ligase [Ardenticatenales bacterium]
MAPNDDPPPAGTEIDIDALGGMAQLLAARLERLQAIRAAGIDPYPPRVERTHMTADAVAAFDTIEAAGGDEGPAGVKLCGRLVGALRRMGGSMFVHLQDQSGTVQLHLRRDRMGEADFGAAIDRLDPGDFVQADGTMFRTRAGEVSLAVDRVTMLAKSLRPLPEKWRGLTDVETRLRQRYLDMLSNESVRQRFIQRSLIVRAMRTFLDGRGFLEVETPTLQPIYGGGAARPFETHYHALGQTMYLRIADELYLKRCLVGGLERVYEICKDFRNEGIDRTHMPEFTMMECYWAYADYNDVMALVEEMVAAIALAANGTTRVTLPDGGPEIELAPPWRRWTVRDAVQDTTGIDIAAADTLAALRAAIAERGLHVAPQPTWAKTVDELVGDYVEPQCVQPTFLMDHPVALSPLAKRKPDDPRWAERFEPIVAGFELGNSFSELNDPIEQRERFEEMARQKAAGDDEQPPIDDDFIEALAHGMPPTGGLGIGVDRLVMVLTGTMNIREVVLFPAMRTEE